MSNKYKILVIGSGLSTLDYAKIEAQLTAAGFTLQEANEAFMQLGRSMRGLSVMEDMFNEPIKLRPPASFPEHKETNFTPERPYGWYRQFEKKNGKRNKKLWHAQLIGLENR